MKTKMWAIKRRETFGVTYTIESKEELTESEAKDLLFRDGSAVADRFDRSWIEDSPVEEWEALGVPDGKTFSIRFEGDDYKLILVDKS